MVPTRLVVLACGNDSRGDDALAPAFLARASAASDPPGVETRFVADYQLQPEHAFDLDECDLALFVDATRTAVAPYEFRRVVPAPSPTFTTHGVPPAAVLDAFALTFGRRPPPAYVLGIRGESFVLGEPLRERACVALEAALALFADLRSDATEATWSARASALPAGAGRPASPDDASATAGRARGPV